MYLLELVLEVCSAHTDTSAKTTLPLGESSIHDRLVKVSPLVDQTRFSSTSGWVNFLLQYTTDAIYMYSRLG